MNITVEKVGPKRARELLKGNTMNRNLRPKVVQRYASDMKAGKWSNIGDPIRVNGDGTLLDGQHRLQAVVESKRTIELVVVSGVSKSSIMNMDSGVKRTFSDTLKLAGHKNVHQLGAAARWGFLYEHPDRTLFHDSASHAELAAYLDDNPLLIDSVNWVVAKGGHVRDKGIKTVLAMLRYYSEHKDEFEVFLDRYHSGVGLEAKSPILALRRFTENATIGTTRPTVKVLHAVTIKAWNAWLEGRPVTVLSYKPGGSCPEPFPTIRTSA